MIQQVLFRAERVNAQPYQTMSKYDESIQTVSRVLKNRHNVIRERVRIFKCDKCEAQVAEPGTLICKDKNCRGTYLYHRTIPQSKVEEITSRRAARQCPRCMKMFYPWVEQCPYCNNPTIKGILADKKTRLAKMYEFSFIK